MAASRICNGLQHLSARLDLPSDVREEGEETGKAKCLVKDLIQHFFPRLNGIN